MTSSVHQPPAGGLSSAADVTITSKTGGVAGDIILQQGAVPAEVARFTAAGRLTFGGDATANLYRFAPGELRSDGHIESAQNLYAKIGGAAQVAIGGAGPAGQAGVQFGPADVNIYRLAAARLATDHLLQAVTLGLATKVKAGTPVDADWAAAPPDGTVVGDSTGSKIWIRLGGIWKGVAVA